MTTDEQRKEGFDVLRRIIAGQKVEIPAWMTEAREKDDRAKAAMQKQPDPAATQTDSISQYSEEDMMVFTDDLGNKVR